MFQGKTLDFYTPRNDKDSVTATWLFNDLCLMFNEMPLDLAACLFGPSACLTSSEHIRTTYDNISRSTTVPEISTPGMFPIWDLAFKGLYLGPGGKAFLIDPCLNNVIEEFQGLQTGLRRDKSWDDSCVWEYTHDAILSEDEWSNILYLS